MKISLQQLGYLMGCWLSCPRDSHGPSGPPEPHIERYLLPGDVLLVEGSSRLSVVIQYLTQSSWSHAALFIGQGNGRRYGAKGNECFIEADVAKGVRLIGLEEFRGHHLRICRPQGLDQEEINQLITFAGERLGYQYDLRNIVDLARYFLPLPPVPQRWRRHFLTMGSGDPTRAICSTLITQAFQSVNYPILPIVKNDVEPRFADGETSRFQRRHYSLFTPRDFDLSPYFAVIKPRLINGFDPHRLLWRESDEAQ